MTQQAKVKQSTIYFASFGEEYIKIGITDDINGRMRHLAMTTPLHVKLLGVIAGDVKSEQTIQEMFKRYRIKGEFFQNTKEILKFIGENAHLNHVLPETTLRPRREWSSEGQIAVEIYNLTRRKRQQVWFNKLVGVMKGRAARQLISKSVKSLIDQGIVTFVYGLKKGHRVKLYGINKHALRWIKQIKVLGRAIKEMPVKGV